MTFIAIFFVNAVLSFALSLVVAHFLGPDAFGRYAVALSVSVVINTALFEWLRFSTVRFYSERVRRDAPNVERTLNLAYAGMAMIVVTGTTMLLVLGWEFGFSPSLLAGAAALGLCTGIFDYRAAAARARFLDRRYGALLLGRGVLAFGLAVAAAGLWAEPAFVLLASAASYAFAVIVVRDWREPGARGRFDPALITHFARYAVPLVAATAILQLLPFMNRAAMAARAGYAEAGVFALASELSVRFFQNLGSALDLALFQLAVRAAEHGGPEEGERQVARNLGIIAAIIFPATAGLWAIWPSFEALFIPAAFRGSIAPSMMLTIPAFAAYALLQYASAPLFQIRKRTGPVIVAALFGLATNAVLLGLPTGSDAAGLAAVQLAGFAAGLAAMIVLVLMLRPARLPWRDIALSALASAVMMGALWPWRQALPPLAGLTCQVLAGAVLYGALALAFDLAGARSLLARGRFR